LDSLDEFCQSGLLNYYSAFAGLCDQPDHLIKTQIKLIKQIPTLLKQHNPMFASIQASSTKNGINFEAIKFGTDLIKQIAEIDPFYNLKFAITFNVAPNIPFFPSAYS